MLKRKPSVLLPIIRAAGYAFTSLFAHFSGYLLQASPPSASDVPLILTLWAASLPFFLAYAISYDVEDPLGQEEQQLDEWVKWNARLILPIGVGLVVALLLTMHFALTRKAPDLTYWLGLAIFISVFLFYGIYTVRTAKLGPPLIRHQLVWPVIFSIALPLYSGIIFSPKRHDVMLFTPILCLILFAFVSNKFPRGRFVTSGVAVLALMIILSVVGFDAYIGHFSAMTFYLSIAAYLAVFEAWGLTASLALGEYIISRQSQSNSPTNSSKSSRYYLAAFVALSAAALTFPMLYIFSDYGRLFFWGTTIHALLAFLTWFWAGEDPQRLRNIKWVILKTVVGFLFLAVLVLDAWFINLPSKRFLSNLVVPGVLSIVFTISVLAMTYRYRQDKETNFNNWIKRLPMSRSGVLVLTVLLSLAMAAGTLVIQGLQVGNSIILFKSDRVFMFYILAILVASALLLFKGGVRLIAAVVGLVLSARLFTSTVIGAAVLLPALKSGSTLIEGALSALPFFLASAAGFLFNDACDYERDRISKPFRPIPKGLVGRRTVLLAGVIATLLAGMLAFWESSSVVGRMAQLGAIIGVVLYNPLAARIGWLKGPFTALLCMSPLVFVVSVYGYPDNFWWIIVAGYLFCVGRELLMDILDTKGDQATGLGTLPLMIGVVRTEFLVLLCTIVAAIALLIFRHSSSAILEQRTIDLALIGLVMLGLLWWKTQAPRNKRRLIRLSWIPMLLALAVFL